MGAFAYHLAFIDHNDLIRVENVKNIEEYIDRIDEMIERKKCMGIPFCCEQSGGKDERR